MARPWTILATHDLDDARLELRQRGDTDFLILIDGRVLMNSFSRSSEEALSRLGLAHLAGTPAPKVLVGGLGMAFTLRAALDVLPPVADVVVAELNAVIVEWCKGPLGPATDHAVADPRVRLEMGDVADLIAKTPPGQFDAILLDLYEGPNDASQGINDPFYSAAALARQHRAVAPGGVLAVWSEDRDERYEQRVVAAGFRLTTHAIGSGGRKHIVYLCARSGG
ncbi:MAG: spermidine synthase [Myxococcota bacterium]|nr:spermidine synthase [Myxococcota bacterium]